MTSKPNQATNLTQDKPVKLTKKGSPDKRSLGSSSKNLKVANKVIIKALNRAVNEGGEDSEIGYETDSSEEAEVIVEQPLTAEPEPDEVNYSKILQEKDDSIAELNKKISNWELTYKEEVEKVYKEKEEAVRQAKLGRIDNLRQRMILKF